MIKVAVITRTKNRPTFLRRAIESVANQTFRDFIHVIVNDGGNQKDIESVLGAYDTSITDKIKLFHRDTSSNAPDTIFNESIDRVDSEFFVIHDDDDTWHKDFLLKTAHHLDKNASLGAVVTRTDKIIEQASDNQLIFKKKEQWMPDVKVINLYRQCIDNQFTPIATLFRRNAYQAIGKFDSTLPVVGDWEFGIRLLKQYDADFLDPGFALANYHHRVQADNSFTNHDHRYYFNQVSNRYLREELSKGQLGIGYIISQTKYEQGYIAKLAGNLVPKPIVKLLKRRAR